MFFFVVFESAEWPTTAIYAGQVFTLGNWRECLRISSYDITGKYCLVEANYNFDYAKYKNDESLNWPDERASVWNAIENVKKIHRLDFFSFFPPHRILNFDNYSLCQV